MDRDYIEHFWSQEVYECFNCEYIGYYSFRYCPMCASEQNTEEGIEQLTKHEAISDFNTIQEFLNETKGLRIRFWDYCISHCITQLRIYIPAEKYEDKTNAVILLGGTKDVSVSTEAWDANLSLECKSKGGIKRYILTDEKAKIQSECGVIGIYKNMPAVFFGT